MSELRGVLVALHVCVVYVHNKENLRFIQIYAAEVTVEGSVCVHMSLPVLH